MGWNRLLTAEVGTPYCLTGSRGRSVANSTIDQTSSLLPTVEARSCVESKSHGTMRPWWKRVFDWVLGVSDMSYP